MSKSKTSKKNIKKTEEQLDREKEVRERLISTTHCNTEEVLSKLSTSLQGLSEEEVDSHREIYGNNSVTEYKKDSLAKRLVNAFINPFTCILIFLAVINLMLDVVMATPGEEDYSAVLIITGMVLVSGLLKFVQETRSGKAADALLKLITTTCTVQRKETGRVEIPLDDVVVGDIVHISAGDMVPADIRIIEAKDLFVSQSALTGESEQIEKLAQSTEEDKDLTSYSCLAFMGSNVISGTATGIVIATGDDTIFGTIAQQIQEEPVETSFQKGVNSVSWVIIRFMLVMVPVVFLLAGYTQGDWLSAFTFAISVAVGLTPEMLPMIVSTCLAKGAVSMSKKKTVIKNLNSIQSFGAMDVLCTDKTGTLTQNSVVLEYHMDINGDENERVLKHAYLNSYFQTGLKNLMDKAIINKTEEEGLDIKTHYKKVDEIPFDFERRRMSVVVEDKKGKTQVITKGAVEEMLSCCSYIEIDGEVKPLTNEVKKSVLSKVNDLNDDGLRVIAIAQKTNPLKAGAFSVKDESDMVLIGYLAFLDPPKESTAETLKTLKDYGVDVKILTGDNERVTRSICKMVGLQVNNLLLGEEIENMAEEELKKAVEDTTVFAKLSPSQKAKIVEVLRENGHTVGFMGDGINDSVAMHAADVGISVDSAVDVAKESADIILLEKDLRVLEEGIIEGRKTYANMIKYIKMTASSNFGNMFSVLVSSALIPYEPMAAMHILLLNLIYDISCTAIPWDNVDKEFIKKPKNWDPSSIVKFMLWFGPTSSVFDITTYALSYFIICPTFVPGAHGRLFHQIAENETQVRAIYVMMAQSIWFLESMWSQTLVIHLIRTKKIPFIQSNASFQLLTLTLLGIAVVTVIPFTAFGRSIGLYAVPKVFFLWLALTIACYMVLVTIVKKIYVKKYKELL